MSRRAAEYQTKITGMPASHVHELNGVKFDGFKDGVLLEAKGLGYANFVKNGKFAKWWEETGAKQLVQQARNQKRAANGVPIQWHFAEEVAANATRKLFSDNNIKGIEIIVTP